MGGDPAMLEGRLPSPGWEVALVLLLLGKVNLWKPQFPHLQSGGENSNDIRDVKPSTQDTQLVMLFSSGAVLRRLPYTKEWFLTTASCSHPSPLKEVTAGTKGSPL
jgi:hypothetical protein